MGTLLVVFAVTTLMIAANALYVAAEFATVSARKSRLHQEAEAGNRLARILMPIIDDPHKLDNYVAACQLGITASSLVLGFYGQSAIATAIVPLFMNFGGELAAQSISAVVVLIFLTILQVVLGELLPKSIALRYPERLAELTAIPMTWSLVLFRPFIALFNGTGVLILRILGVPPAAAHTHLHAPEEIEMLVAASAKGGLLDRDERELLDNAFQMSEKTAADIMVPRTSVVAAPLSMPVADQLAQIVREGYSRMPLYRSSIDDIAGFVHIRDLYRLYVGGETDVQGVLRKAPLVPESASAADVWNRLRQEESYVAIVFDEHGGTAGMITVEDMIEEIFGNVEDEFDGEVIAMTSGVDGRIVVAGDESIADVNEEYHLQLPTENVHTIGGLIIEALGREPHQGDEVTIAGVSLRADVVAGHAVRQVGMRLPEPADDDSEAQP
jgi:CBS domain containing-hemolysin-like protein